MSFLHALALAMLVGMERWPGNANGQEVSQRWAHHPRCVGLARAQLRKALADWGLASIEDTALVVLSELLTNAVEHAQASPEREIQTRFQCERDGVRIAVDDADAHLPKTTRFRGVGNRGRGLLLVAALADCWGVRRRGSTGKSVWALVKTSAEDGDA